MNAPVASKLFVWEGEGGGELEGQSGEDECGCVLHGDGGVRRVLIGAELLMI